MKPNRHSGDSEWPLVYGSPQLLSDAFARKRVGVEPVVLSFAKGRPQRERKQPNTLMAQWEEVMEFPQLKKSCNASRTAKSENGGAGLSGDLASGGRLAKSRRARCGHCHTCLHPAMKKGSLTNKKKKSEEESALRQSQPASTKAVAQVSGTSFMKVGPLKPAVGDASSQNLLETVKQTEQYKAAAHLCSGDLESACVQAEAEQSREAAALRFAQGARTVLGSRMFYFARKGDMAAVQQVDLLLCACNQLFEGAGIVSLEAVELQRQQQNEQGSDGNMH